MAAVPVASHATSTPVRQRTAHLRIPWRRVQRFDLVHVLQPLLLARHIRRAALERVIRQRHELVQGILQSMCALSIQASSGATPHCSVLVYEPAASQDLSCHSQRGVTEAAEAVEAMSGLVDTTLTVHHGGKATGTGDSRRSTSSARLIRSMAATLRLLRAYGRPAGRCWWLQCVHPDQPARPSGCPAWTAPSTDGPSAQLEMLLHKQVCSRSCLRSISMS